MSVTKYSFNKYNLLDSTRLNLILILYPIKSEHSNVINKSEHSKVINKSDGKYVKKNDLNEERTYE